MLNFLAVFIGGGLGASLRYAITTLSNKILGFAHAGTFAANIAGCLIIGYVFGLAMNKADFFPPQVKLFITVGFLGGLTTFSTFSNESYCLLKDGKIGYCALYMTLSIVVGLIATFAGYMMAK